MRLEVADAERRERGGDRAKTEGSISRGAATAPPGRCQAGDGAQSALRHHPVQAEQCALSQLAVSGCGPTQAVFADSL
jgi:hypothetical protein